MSFLEGILALCLVALEGGRHAAWADEGSESQRNCSALPPYLPATAVNTSLRLRDLRASMISWNISAYIIPATDAHLSEYIAPRDARLAWMSGFTGSAGTAVVTQDKAVLWTDSRYWIQAERQLDCNWELERDSSTHSVTNWIIMEIPEGDEVGFDPFLFSVDTFTVYNSNLAPAERILKSIPDNLVDKIWTDRPPLSPDGPTRLPDGVIGLFNLRGNDIPFNPFFYSYTLLTMDEIWLFVHIERLTEDVKLYLNASCLQPLCVQLMEYNSVRSNLELYLQRDNVRVWVGTEYTNQALYEIITPVDRLLTSSYSPVLTSKAVRDAVAVIQLLLWLEKNVPAGRETELTAAHFVDQCRSPSNETARKLTVEEMYLVDSGGQYLDGTTDITRTVHWGKPTDFQKEAYTRVLMGNIEITRTIFPAGTRGVNMEMLGRRALWEVGLNYGHGTGHGVGNYFGVHEWPVGFQTNNIPFQEGMFTSIEPGYYKDNDFGIRIEDVALIVPANAKHSSSYLTFETVSLVPYDRKLINTALLSPEQLHWLNSYYENIRAVVGPELQKQGLEEEYYWMKTQTAPFLIAGASAAGSSHTLLLTVVLPLASFYLL
ncbi:hypothetical protein DNTS_020517 [Danionella cerebrum]|uniref:Xaa-Pro aminopeptidase 2 n=1 Tax=Danionella cerebrum TaxID=2873325 RepID=A0A553P996_9TELE|nr:hypothetical protein DNTS_020517 [Danionella translucida]